MFRRFLSGPFKFFLQSATSASTILFGCVVLSLILANSSLAGSFEKILDYDFGFHSTLVDLRYPVSSWINDGLMAIFFLLVGLEIKREVLEGELSSPKKAILPIICAMGGATIPALIYTFFNSGNTTAAGWGIPMATDIAFALAILSLLGKKVPLSLKIFLAALAIVDDLLAIIVIAIFYATKLHYIYLVYAGLILALLVVFNRSGIKHLGFYLVPGLFIWYFIHHSGIHATIAGVLTALTIPASVPGKHSPLQKLEHMLGKPVNFVIIPLFALANTNIHFETAMVQGLFTSLGAGIVFGLLIGKPAGVLLVSWLSVKLNISKLPDQAGWMHILGLGLLAGIGFTMSIFISILSFDNPMLVQQAKFSILIASIISGVSGFLILSHSSKATNTQLHKQLTTNL